MNSHDDLNKKARTVFENSVATIDVATANRLRLMRRDTLAQPASNKFKAFLIPVGASLAIALGIALFMPQYQMTKAVTEQDTLYISAEDDADADVLTWLADAPVEVSSTMQGSL